MKTAAEKYSDMARRLFGPVNYNELNEDAKYIVDRFVDMQTKLGEQITEININRYMSAYYEQN